MDTFALGVILVNMLTGSYLFESCLTAEYERLMADEEYLADVLRSKRVPPMDATESANLISLLQAMLHPDPEMRLPIDEVENHSWLTLYKSNSESEIGVEMYERVHSSDSFLKVLVSQTQSDGSTMSESETSSAHEISS